MLPKTYNNDENLQTKMSLLNMLFYNYFRESATNHHKKSCDTVSYCPLGAEFCPTGQQLGAATAPHVAETETAVGGCAEKGLLYHLLDSDKDAETECKDLQRLPHVEQQKKKIKS